MARPKVKPRKPEWYGCRPDTLDKRDLLSVADAEYAFPQEVDLRPYCPPVMDQGALGSCTAHGITGALRYLLIKAGQPDQKLSRLQLYYDERVVEGSVASDAGAEIRDGIKCAHKMGVGRERLWPYKIGNFKRKPPAACYKDALAFQGLEYRRVAISARGIKYALAKDQVPVVIGFSVYESFESKEANNTGIIPMPAPGEELLGGHCVYVVGYGQKEGYFTCRNSWGTSWGDKGDFYMPEEYLSDGDLGADYWIIKTIG